MVSSERASRSLLAVTVASRQSTAESILLLSMDAARETPPTVRRPEPKARSI
jgi:hypothetical protein